MRYWLIGLLLFLSACFRVSSTDDSIMLEYDEPTKNADGTPIDDLHYILLDWNIDGERISTESLASATSGGANIVYTLAQPATSYKLASVVAYAVDYSGNVSEPSQELKIVGKKPNPGLQEPPLGVPHETLDKFDKDGMIIWYQGPSVSSATIYINQGTTGYLMITSTTNPNANNYVVVPSSMIPGMVGRNEEINFWALGFSTTTDKILFESSFTAHNDLLAPAKLR